MTALIKIYIDDLNRAYSTGKATEHSHRPALKKLLEAALNGVQAINEPKRSDCGAPDYIVARKDIPVGYVEAKDIGVDLNGKAHKAQFDRYKQSLDNLIITDYLDFRRYIKGELADSVRIAEVEGGKITPIKANFGRFEQLLKDFGLARPQCVTAPADIARMMAGKARLMAAVIEKALEVGGGGDNPLFEQMNAFKVVLIHDINPKEFADVYAQTITYGLFAARLHAEPPDAFRRQNAASLIPKTNPFLRQLFDNIAGLNIDDRIAWIVDDLADAFRAVNTAEFSKDAINRVSTRGHTPQNDGLNSPPLDGRGWLLSNDPMIHFYEDFLSAYDPALRKSRGVWYTPQAAVTFIVRAVDDILQKEFKLPMGLADTSTAKIKADGRETDAHKVQILDPATGTGTFLAETINRIYDRFRNQGGMWQKYVKEHLIPRLNGFEVLMAPYTMAHIKLEQLLSQTGYSVADNQRLRIYLTNSLEEHHPATESFFSQFLAREANEANSIKRDAPIMVVMGNPPYSVSSQNKGDWIQNLIADYKKNLNERKLNLDDDYIKFIRYGQYYIERNGEGILAYISNNSFIDGVTHRQMRKTLLDVFDKIYILDLHGSSKKKEACPDGSRDENVFDIMQGVSINIFVKTGRKAKGAPAKAFHSEFYGLCEEKYEFLSSNSLRTIKWRPLKFGEGDRNYFFVPKDFGFKDEYEKGFKVTELFPVYVSGFQTKRDNVTIHFSENELARIKDIFINEETHSIRTALRLPEDGRDWTVKEAQKDLKENSPQTMKVMYRPFDDRFTYFTGKSKGFVAYPRAEMAAHLSRQDNVSLLTCRQQSTFGFQHVFVSRLLSDMCGISSQTKETGYIFPLYLYPESDKLLSDESRRPNLNASVVGEIARRTGLRYVEEKEAGAIKKTFAPLDLLDYIYAVLHSPAYRERYKEFLRIDFPRVPYPENADRFRALSNLGAKLRRLHLLDGVEPREGTADYPNPGGDEIEKIQYDETEGGGKVFINKNQFFDNVPPEAWDFYIGGYQPARKWLKDRKGRVLSYNETLHYRRIITVLLKTIEIMDEIKTMETL